MKKHRRVGSCLRVVDAHTYQISRRIDGKGDVDLRLGRGYGVAVTDKKRYARVWIVVGFALTAVGSILNMINLLSHNYLGEGNFRADLQLVALPLGSLVALWAWWLLSKIATLETNHAPLFRKAFLGLTIQSLCVGVEYMNLLWFGNGLNQYTWSFWLQGIGSVVTALGFLLMSRAFSNNAAVGRSV